MDSLTEEVIDSVKSILEPLLLEEGIDLVDIEYRREGRGKVLRIYMDKEGGITIGDCTKISRELGTLLDVYDIIPDAYTLEVSSAGLDRPLKKKKDFERFMGRKVKIKTRNYIDKRRVFIGKLVNFQDGVLTVEVDKTTCLIPFDEIEKANLELDF